MKKNLNIKGHIFNLFGGQTPELQSSFNPVVPGQSPPPGVPEAKGGMFTGKNLLILLVVLIFIVGVFKVLTKEEETDEISEERKKKEDEVEEEVEEEEEIEEGKEVEKKIEEEKEEEVEEVEEEGGESEDDGDPSMKEGDPSMDEVGDPSMEEEGDPSMDEDPYEDDYGGGGSGSPSICGNKGSYKYDTGYCSMNDEEAHLNDKWDSCDRDDWLETNYTDHSNSLSWLPGYKKWKKEAGGSKIVPGESSRSKNKKVYYGYKSSEKWEDHNTKPWKNSYKNSYIDNKTGKWVHLCKCSKDYNPFTNCRCKYGFYYDTTASGDGVCKRYPNNEDGNPCIKKENIGKNMTSLNKESHRIGDFYNLQNPECNFHSPDGNNGLYMSDNVQKMSDKCCPSCVHKFYASNLSPEKLRSGLKNNDLNKENKQPWAENGRNTVVGFLPTNFNNHHRKRAGFDVSLNIPVGYNSRPPYYYPVWNMKAGSGEYIPEGTGNKGEDKNFSGLLLGNDVGGKSKCVNSMGEPGDDSCETQDRMIIHNNLFHCRRGSWNESADWKTPPRGAGPTDEDKSLDTYNLYDYDWVNNMWIKKDEKYNRYGYYGTRDPACSAKMGKKRGDDGYREAKHIDKTCDDSGYWINGALRKCNGHWVRHERTFRDDYTATCS